LLGGTLEEDDEESFTDGDDTRTEMLPLATMPFSVASEENVKETNRRPYKVKPSAKNYARPVIPPASMSIFSWFSQETVRATEKNKRMEERRGMYDEEENYSG
jgi:hypothetical protein